MKYQNVVYRHGKTTIEKKHVIHSINKVISNSHIEEHTIDNDISKRIHPKFIFWFMKVEAVLYNPKVI